MIIDLYGLPGSGKSTVVDEFNRKYQIYEKKGTAEFIALSKMKKISLLKLLKNPPHRKFFYLLFKLCKKRECKNRDLGAYERFIAKLYSLYVFNLYHQARDEEQQFILDEGIIQSLVPITLGYQLERNALYSLIQLLDCDKMISVHCVIGPLECLSRIERRNRNTAAMDELDKDDLVTFIEQYTTRLDELKESFNHYTKKKVILDMTENPIKLVKQLEMVIEDD